MAAESNPKILHLITEVIVGGAQDNTILSVEGLRRRGYEVDLASAPGGGWERRARETGQRQRSHTRITRTLHVEDLL